MKNIHTAIKLAGGVKQLAKNIGVPHQSVYFWASGDRRVPAEHCLTIEYFTAGEVRCEDLRPDVHWGVLRNQHAEAA